MSRDLALREMRWSDTPGNEGSYRRSLYRQWAANICRRNASGRAPASTHDEVSDIADERRVYDFLRERLQHVLRTVPRQAGWLFLDCFSLGPHMVVPAVIWADGLSEGSQCSPLHRNNLAGGRWWPCMVGNIADHRGLLPFYCPALAWMAARPWFAHPTRVFLIGNNVASSSSSSSAGTSLSDSDTDTSITGAATPIAALSALIVDSSSSAAAAIAGSDAEPNLDIDSGTDSEWALVD